MTRQFADLGISLKVIYKYPKLVKTDPYIYLNAFIMFSENQNFILRKPRRNNQGSVGWMAA